MTMSEKEAVNDLIKKAKAGDRRSFDALYRLYMTPIYRFAYARLKNKDDAEDVVQEVFLRAYQAMGGFEERGVGMLPYLFTAARNLIINRGKKKRAEPLPNEDLDRETDGTRASDMSIANEDRALVYAALDSLSEDDRSVIELRFFAEHSYADIARSTGKREDAVRQRVARAIKRMRASMIERQHPTELYD